MTDIDKLKSENRDLKRRNKLLEKFRSHIQQTSGYDTSNQREHVKNFWLARSNDIMRSYQGDGSTLRREMLEDEKPIYLLHLERAAHEGSVQKLLKVTKASVEKLKAEDERFASDVQDVLYGFAGEIHEEVFVRGVVGEVEDVWHQGRVVGSKIKKSDSLLGKLYDNHCKTEKAKEEDADGGLMVTSRTNDDLGVPEGERERQQQMIRDKGFAGFGE